MFDTMTLTKVLGGFCGTLLVFLLGGWAAEAIYHSGGHGEGEQAYVIEVEEESTGEEGAAEDEGPAFEEVFASADAAAGEELWRNCRACHALEEGVNGTGPYLYGVVGRDVASVEGFNYSGALVEQADVWTPENLNHFLEDPSGWAPGTAMGYAGMRRIEDRANLIAYLDSIGG
ncbi:c-type cytochrome [Histidinibacterium aquaticum]|uniref:Cytochrome c family protein n=1 Tax=Histidinibacterium aquaticum TaxID=2613962 RepID=A0A5J5GB85_9RHOB|nr:cytochrome c family protein [Histidinibacterium aquaticum]KAA9005261.1 cytochrome c family protein [Histidinibacterium aquaticum]